jgi:hypothetical protein
MPGHSRYRRKCGAKTRRGTSCRMQSHFQDGRGGGHCRLHGGLSSGPKSPEGKARSLAAATAGRNAYWQRWRDAGRPALPWHRRAPRVAPMSLAQWRAQKQQRVRDFLNPEKWGGPD